MRLKFLALILVLSTGANAQIYMRVHQKDTSVLGFPISTIDSVRNVNSLTRIIRLGGATTIEIPNSKIDSLTHAFPVTNNLYNVISADAAPLSQLKADIDNAGLNPYPLGLTGNMTVFAPSDALLNGLQIDMTEEDLQYHILNEKILSSQIPAGTKNLIKSTISTTNFPKSDSLFISRLQNVQTGGSPLIIVNGVPVDNANRDINASNGVMHKLPTLLGPDNQLRVLGFLFAPSDNTVYEEVSNLTGLDSLEKAIKIAEQADPSIKTLLQSGRVTLIAPSDSAFIDILKLLNFPSIQSWYNSLSGSFVQTIRDHIIIDRQFVLNMFNEGANGVSTIEGSKVQLAKSTPLNRWGFQLANGSQFSPLLSSGSFDFMYKNGVIHFTRQLMIRQ